MSSSSSRPIRHERLNELLYQELSTMVGMELVDPDLHMASVSDVRISPDLRQARVYVTHDGSEAEDDTVLAALERASSYLRRELSQRVTLRYVPDLHFIIDRSAENARRVEDILAQIQQERAQQEAETDPDEANADDKS